MSCGSTDARPWPTRAYQGRNDKRGHKPGGGRSARELCRDSVTCYTGYGHRCPAPDRLRPSAARPRGPSVACIRGESSASDKAAA